MAIYQRKRDFEKIFSEIKLNVIPLKFVKGITCVLSDGKTVVIDEKEIREIGTDDNGEFVDLEYFIKQFSFIDNLQDLNIRLNYEKVEKEVSDNVRRLLDVAEK